MCLKEPNSRDIIDAKNILAKYSKRQTAVKHELAQSAVMCAGVGVTPSMVKDNSEIEEAELLERIANNKSIGGRSAIQVLVSTLASRGRSVCKQRGSSDEMFKGF
ncbi:jg16636 [Pararge aegeria aegeria]|uniref:Jg16636 protein n=1 Tax=Pararge aegeria aegeria TaxID=348720 RepID=A0A8S4RAI9_9NEOP|nr:jg16636 [Pararge aegeria aegeria]